jgi:L-lactate dehydrogenase complex protein LldF
VRTGLDQRIDVALADLGLQQALSNVTMRFLAARTAAAAQVEDWEELCDQANAIKRHTIANLSLYLQQLEARVLERGGQVAWAEDAAQACAYIVELARARGIRLAVKSKSMVTEEIELNTALEAAGVESVETDLGEYIIQLAGEKPSHIVAPAIHKTRQQVSELFQRKLGLPPTEDIAQLTAQARAVLRSKFLAAGMGISGANFAIAETGSIVLMENEGNIRFTTGAPRIHVAVVGIEKVIPRLRDLVPFLALIARSATGQKLGSYVSLLTGARRPGQPESGEPESGEPDGPEEFHLVLLDNGRTRVLADPELRETLYCIRCGACLNICPVYRKIGGYAYPWVYSGPIGAILTPQIKGLAAEPKLPFVSSLCGACHEVCPVKIRIPEILLELRHRENTQNAHPLERLVFKLWAAAMRRPWLYEAGGALARFLPLPVGPLATWHKTRELPTPPAQSFRQWWRKRHSKPSAVSSQPSGPASADG